jgi:outer membrane protein TolC
MELRRRLNCDMNCLLSIRLFFNLCHIATARRSRLLKQLASLLMLSGFLFTPLLSQAELAANLAPVVLVEPAPKPLTSIPLAAANPVSAPSPSKETALADPVKKKIRLEEVAFETPLEPVLELDIPTLLRLIDDNSIELALAKNHVVQSRWGLAESMTHLLPSGSMFNYYERYRGSDIFIGQTPFPSNRDTYQTKYMASYSVQLGGKDLFDIKSSWHGLNRVKKMEQQTYKQVILELLTQYFAYLRDISAIRVAKETVRQAEVQVRLSESRYRAGFTTKLDVTQAQGLLAEKQGELVRAESQKMATEYGLASMLKLAVGVRLKPVDNTLKPIQLIDSTIKLPQLLQMAMANRPDVKAMVESINEARSRYASTRAQLLPTVTVSGFKRRVGPQNQLQPSHEVFASISYDARYMGLELLSQLGQEKARVKEMMLQKEKQLYDIQRELSESYLSSNLFQEQIKINEQKVKVAEESFRVARHRRMSGTGISLDVVQAEKDLSEARQEYYTVVMNYNIAQLKLLFQTGQLSPQRILTALALTS